MEFAEYIFRTTREVKLNWFGIRTRVHSHFILHHWTTFTFHSLCTSLVAATSYLKQILFLSKALKKVMYKFLLIGLDVEAFKASFCFISLLCMAGPPFCCQGFPYKCAFGPSSSSHNRGLFTPCSHGTEGNCMKNWDYV